MNGWLYFISVAAALAALVVLLTLLLGGKAPTGGTFVLFSPLWIAVAAPLWALAVLQRGAEQLWELLRSPRIRCPHPDCFRPVRTVGRACPRCHRVHLPLYPELFEPLWQHCPCGGRLPTTALLGRNRLVAYCPHCVRRLPQSATTVPAVHVAFVGGTSAGKTMLMAAMVAGLESWAGEHELTVSPASPVDGSRTEALRQQLAAGSSVQATTDAQPRAVMLVVGRGRRRRLLHLYDPMGAALEDAASVREQRYLAHADGVVLVTDVLADPEVRASLDRSDADRALAAAPALQGPVQTFERLTGELSGLSGGRRRIPVAVVVTKRDMLRQLGSLPTPGDRTEDWLVAAGLGGLVRGLEYDFEAARYWTVSARDAGGATGRAVGAGVGARGGAGAGAATTTAPPEAEQRHAAVPLLWLLSRSGLGTAELTNQQNDYWAGWMT